MSKYSALAVAEYIIAYSGSKERIMSNLKLQKVLYFVQAEFLVSTGEECFEDEIQAMDFGPVIPAVYRRFRMFGSGHIPYPFNESSFRISPKDRERINGIVAKCADYSAAKLTEITQHQTPWVKNFNRHVVKVIPSQDIKEFFESPQNK